MRKAHAGTGTNVVREIKVRSFRVEEVFNYVKPLNFRVQITNARDKWEKMDQKVLAEHDDAFWSYHRINQHRVSSAAKGER